MSEENLLRPEVTRGCREVDQSIRDLLRVTIYASRLRNVLQMLEWGGPERLGVGACPACTRYPSQGHSSDCFLAEVIKPMDALGHAYQTLRDAQAFAHRQQYSLSVLTDGIRCCLADLDTNMANLARMLDRI